MAKGQLDGKVAIVTGAGSSIGLGRAMTLALVEAGARVAMVDVNQQALEQTAGDARELGGDDAVATIVADVSSPEDTQRAVRETIEQLGGLHVLVNNAGINLYSSGLSGESAQPFWEVDPDAWRKVISVNLSGPFLMAHAAVGHLLDQGWGRIIGVTTSLDTMIRGKNTPYGPTKAGHEALMAAIAQEVEGTGVTANVLVPGGATNTNMVNIANESDRVKLIQPQVMSGPVVWLASDASDGTNGMRFIGENWDDRLPIDERVAAASAPTAWPQLGRSPRMHP